MPASIGFLENHDDAIQTTLEQTHHSLCDHVAYITSAQRGVCHGILWTELLPHLLFKHVALLKLC
jgi:hypothetical protein